MRDPVAERVLRGSTYERARMHHLLLRQSIPEKLHWQGWLLFLVAAVAPVVASGVVDEAATLTGDVTLLLTVATVVTFCSGVGLCLVGVRIGQHPRPAAPAARRLAVAESVWSLFGVATGGIATLATYAVLAGGVVRSTGVLVTEGNRLLTTSLGLDVFSVAAAALVGGVVLHVFGFALERRNTALGERDR